MCGIAGIFVTNSSSKVPILDVCRSMADRLQHRGPDDAGYWMDDNGKIALAHRRLSILDLSSLGHQPMKSRSGRYVVVFNGEIYNHLDIRRDIESGSNCNSVASRWKGHSDTETLLAAVELWGIEGALSKLSGMFAVALYDCEEHILTLFRDRMGEKPLYYGWSGSDFVFASELKAIKAVPGFAAKIDKQALALYTEYGYVPEPFSIYEGIFKLKQGNLLNINTLSTQPNVTPKAITYWGLSPFKSADSTPLIHYSDDNVLNQFEALLNSSVRQQMMSDVPLGAFFSGGIDSSLIVSLMQNQSASRIQTFTIGFSEPGYNEAKYANEIADYLGTDHTELYVTHKDALDVIPQLSDIYDEPFADNSQIPTFLLSKLTRQHVTVALSGDGADELFGGYNRYIATSRLGKLLKYSPSSFRRGVAAAIMSMPLEYIDKKMTSFTNKLPMKFHVPQISEKVFKTCDLLRGDDFTDIYKKCVTKWDQTSGLIQDSRTNVTSAQNNGMSVNSIEDMLLLDALTYLPDDILVKVDRAAMAVSLETRVPFLDYRVVDFAFQLPLKYKIRHGRGKWVVRELLKKYVPEEYFDRPKTGFGIPVGDWLRGPLRGWAETLLNKKRLDEEGNFNSDVIREIWAAHLSKKRNYHAQLWTILMFESWLDTNN